MIFIVGYSVGFQGTYVIHANSEKDAWKEIHRMISVCGGLNSAFRPPALWGGRGGWTTGQCPEAASSCTLMRLGGYKDHHIQDGSSLPTYTWL